MITKTINPVFQDGSHCNLNNPETKIIATIIEYRFFGILLYKKQINYPNPHGYEEQWDFIWKF